MALFGSAGSALFGGGGGGVQGGGIMMPQWKQDQYKQGGGIAGRDSPAMQQWMQRKQPGGIGPSNSLTPGGGIQAQPEAPKNTMNRTQWRDAWMGAGKMNPQQADEWLKSHGATQMEGGGKAGRWTTPHGESLDLQIGRGAAMAGKRGGMITPGWTRMGGGGQKQGPMAPSMGGMMGGGVTGMGGMYGGGMGGMMGGMGGYGTGQSPWGMQQPQGGLMDQPPSMTQQLQGNQPQAQQMRPQATTPYQSMYSRQMGRGY